MVLSFIYPKAEIVISGKVIDDKGTPVPALIVKLFSESKLKKFTKSDSEGRFSIKLDSLFQQTELVVNSLNFEEKILPVNNIDEEILVTLSPKSRQLEEFVVKVPRVRVKGDTLTYDVASYTSVGDRSIEDVIRKIPGVEIADNGTIFYDGEAINNFYIEDLNLLGNKYAIASRNIRPEDISTLSVYQHHQPTKALKDVKFSKSAALNLRLKKGRMLKPIGYLQGATGASDEILWDGSLYTMLISPKSQTIIMGSGNNLGNQFTLERPVNAKPVGAFLNNPFGLPSLPPSRYLNNKSADASVNNLFKIQEDLLLTAEAEYRLDHSSFNAANTTTFLLSNSEKIYLHETVDNNPRIHQPEFSFKIEKNSPTLFFSDKLSFSGNFRNNDYRINSSQDNINQSLHADTYEFSNNLNATVNKNGNIVIITSETNLQRTPRLSMSASADDNSFTLQDIFSTSLKNTERISYSHSIAKRQKLSIDGELKLKH